MFAGAAGSLVDGIAERRKAHNREACEATMGAQTYQAWAHERAAPQFTDWLRERSRPAWDDAVGHRFVRELASGTLPDAVMARYLVQDYAFLDGFVRLVGSAIAKAPSLPDRIPLAQFLGMVTSEENTYFQRSFNALGVADADRSGPSLRAPTRGFHQVVAEAVAAEGYAETLAPLVVFEWLYLDWASAVADSRPEKPFLREWIHLHANAEFAAFVEWLRGQLDRDGAGLAPARQAAVAALFQRTVDLEKAFFEEAYIP